MLSRTALANFSGELFFCHLTDAAVVPRWTEEGGDTRRLLRGKEHDAMNLKPAALRKEQ